MFSSDTLSAASGANSLNSLVYFAREQNVRRIVNPMSKPKIGG